MVREEKKILIAFMAFLAFLMLCVTVTEVANGSQESVYTAGAVVQNQVVTAFRRSNDCLERADNNCGLYARRLYRTARAGKVRMAAARLQPNPTCAKSYRRSFYVFLQASMDAGQSWRDLTLYQIYLRQAEAALKIANERKAVCLSRVGR